MASEQAHLREVDQDLRLTIRVPAASSYAAQPCTSACRMIARRCSGDRATPDDLWPRDPSGPHGRRARVHRRDAARLRIVTADARRDSLTEQRARLELRLAVPFARGGNAIVKLVRTVQVSERSRTHAWSAIARPRSRCGAARRRESHMTQRTEREPERPAIPHLIRQDAAESTTSAAARCPSIIGILRRSIASCWIIAASSGVSGATVAARSPIADAQFSAMVRRASPCARESRWRQCATRSHTVSERPKSIRFGCLLKSARYASSGDWRGSIRSRVG